MHFTKMEGIGNDYIYINGFQEHVENPSALSIRMSRYHFGCSSDGLILILPSDVADFKMQMFNNDGSESAMCGNGIRCVGKYCHDRGLTEKTDFTVEAGDGKICLLHLTLNDSGETESVRVDMGVPELDGEKIPSVAKGCPVLHFPVKAGNHHYDMTLVNMGNPHAVCFVEETDSVPVAVDGPVIESLPDFPERINVEFVQILSRDHIKVRVWERGTGETLACGTGSCASTVASVLNGFCDRRVSVELPGGILQIEWDELNNHVYMTGPADFVYDGEWLKD